MSSNNRNNKLLNNNNNAKIAMRHANKSRLAGSPAGWPTPAANAQGFRQLRSSGAAGGRLLSFRVEPSCVES